MKKTTFLFVILLMISQLSNAQSVTLATSKPASPTKGTVVYDNGTNQLQYWNGSAWIPITNAASGTGWALSGADVYNSNTGTGKVFIGTTPNGSNAKLNIITAGGGYGILHSSNTVNIASYAGTTLGFFGTTSNHPFQLVANGGSQLTILPNGNIGIDVTNPTNKLQIGSVTSGTSGNDLAIGNNGTGTMSIYQTDALTKISSTTDIALKPKNNGAGYVGINIDNPANKLQIGSVGTTNFNGNDFVIGNGTSVVAINQASNVTQIASTTDIALLPRFSGPGRVGINTSTPRAPLDVVSNVPNSSGYTYDYFNVGGSLNGINRCTDCTAYISIYASNSVYAGEFDAYSDARIKDIIGVSNSANDLKILKNLQITDYTLKDKIKNGNKPYKKVIAQQVENYYPQAVSQSTEVVPDIYSLSENVVFDEINKTLKCSLLKSYNIKVGEKVEFVHSEKGKVKAEVIEVSGNSFTVKDWQYPTDKIFVYGREVNDFRSVDYEAISMLGISAIQQLAKENEEFRSKNEELNAKLKKVEANSQQLNARLEAIEALLVKPSTGK